MLIMLHITFVALIYLICGSLYLLNAFNPIPPSLETIKWYTLQMKHNPFSKDFKSTKGVVMIYILSLHFGG